jgi:hypothetical protein
LIAITFNICRPNGQIYEGNWEKNVLNGPAIIYIPDKEPILTEWKNGTLSNNIDPNKTTKKNSIINSVK